MFMDWDLGAKDPQADMELSSSYSYAFGPIAPKLLESPLS